MKEKVSKKRKSKKVGLFFHHQWCELVHNEYIFNEKVDKKI